MSEAQPPTGTWSESEGWIPPEPEQPESIRRAVRLMWIGAGLTVVGIVLTLLMRDAIRDAIEDADDGESTADQIDQAVNFQIIGGVVGGLIAIGLWIWMARTNGEGKAWARTVATVLGVLNVLLTLLSFVGPVTAVGVIFSVAGVALAVWILVLLYRPESTRFYDAHAPN